MSLSCPGSIENKDVGRNMCSSQKSDSTSPQRNIHPCGSNDAVDKVSYISPAWPTSHVSFIYGDDPVYPLLPHC